MSSEEMLVARAFLHSKRRLLLDRLATVDASHSTTIARLQGGIETLEYLAGQAFASEILAWIDENHAD